jgi:hypothetical protein
VTVELREVRSISTLLVICTPAAERGTAKTLRPPLVRAATSSTSATCAQGTKRFSPDST